MRKVRMQEISREHPMSFVQVSGVLVRVPSNKTNQKDLGRIVRSARENEK